MNVLIDEPQISVAPSHDDAWSFDEHLDAVEALRQRLNRVLKGKADVIERVLICLLSRGHLLVEDRPGMGKTKLAKALAEGIGGRFARIQRTPDLLPSDITGFNLFNQKTREFESRNGLVFSDILLADEINRATSRTQSALLEAMAERQVTVDGLRYPLSEEFFVIATQNPYDQHGTYPLLEVQLDRFAMKLSVGYPSEQDELAMLAEAVAPPSRNILPPAFEANQRRALQRFVQTIPVKETVQAYLIQLAKVTRNHADISLGISPRGLLTWQRAAQASACLQGRTFVTPDDVQDVAEPVLVVRLAIESDNPLPVIHQIMESVPVPWFLVRSSQGIPIMFRFATFIAVILLPLFLSGCSETQAEAEHEHHHQHGPRPTFEGAVKHIRHDYRLVLQAASRDDAEHFEHEMQEFIESVKLLPELAAETDLSKADWDRVQAASQSLAAECARISQTKAQPSSAVNPIIEAAFQTLDEIAGKLPARRNEEK
jgi:MoxR-like ATPase